MAKPTQRRAPIPQRTSLRDRAADVEASAARVLKRQKAGQPTLAAVAPSPVSDLRDHWRVARKAVNRPGLPEAMFQKLSAAASEAERAVVDAPVATIQDLACKVEVLRSNFDQNSLDEGVAFETVRAVCDGVDGLAAALGEGLPLAKRQADAVDLSGLGITQLGNLFDVFEAMHHHWLAVGCQPFSEHHDPIEGVSPNAAGRLAEQEATRAALVRDRIADEVGRRQPQDNWQRDEALSLRIKEAALQGSDSEP